jgi:hypothetical protein
MASRQIVVIILLAVVVSGFSVTSVSAQDSPCAASGDSTEDRIGCLDSDGDGWSDADENWTIAMGADAFPNNSSEHADLDLDGIGDNSDEDIDGDGVANAQDVWPTISKIWSDTDEDGYADQGGHELSDNCPAAYGKSKIRLVGCSDIDGDFMPDIYDDDADGDGIRNELERAASSGTILYDPYNPLSTPLDTDRDTIPDVIDSDNDNDGWPDSVELDRGSDIFDADETPFNLYFGINSGVFYSGGLNSNSFSQGYDAESFELSVSAFMEIVFEELVIPLLLIPTYFAIYYVRASKYRDLLTKIEGAESKDELIELEKAVNQTVKDKGIKVYHGLVLRNAIEEVESKFNAESRSIEEE